MEDIARALSGIEGIDFTAKSKIDMATTLRARFESKTIEIPNDAAGLSRCKDKRPPPMVYW
ncbi:MAG TPA: hypothetical protein VED24_04960 [Candidatus Acidoferrum sp.]|nr:hypothetical protein [Candidatus Acidoferrum sp.]